MVRPSTGASHTEHLEQLSSHDSGWWQQHAEQKNTETAGTAGGRRRRLRCLSPDERLTVHWKQRILRVLDGQRPLELPPRFEAFIDLAHQRVLAWCKLDGVLAHGAPGGAHAHSPPRSRPFTKAWPYIGSAAFAGYSMDRPP